MLLKNLLLFFLLFGLVVNGKRPHSTIHVDPSASNFKTVQSAIDSVPSNNSHWVCISIKHGIYMSVKGQVQQLVSKGLLAGVGKGSNPTIDREKVTIPVDKQYIYLKGDGNKRASIVWGSSGSINSSPTFTSHADNIKVENLNFVNSYNYPPMKFGARMKPAVAAMVAGDRTAFYHCNFSGVQDTLLDAMGRHYFKHCIIEGAIDFIFGAGQSIFEECTIVVNVGSSMGAGNIGCITAQGRSGANDSNAFVFKNCNVTGNGKAILGRPWRGYATVIFFNSSLSNIILPQGWDSWFYRGYVNQLTFAEVNCYGPGSNTSNRVAWEAQLSQEMAEYFASFNFIDADNWISKQPY